MRHRDSPTLLQDLIKPFAFFMPRIDASPTSRAGQRSVDALLTARAAAEIAMSEIDKSDPLAEQTALVIVRSIAATQQLDIAVAREIGNACIVGSSLGIAVAKMEARGDSRLGSGGGDRRDGEVRQFVLAVLTALTMPGPRKPENWSEETAFWSDYAVNAGYVAARTPLAAGWIEAAIRTSAPSPPATPPSPAPSTLPAAGWYTDPGGQDQLRWWDGTQWTDHLTPRG